MSDDLLQPVDDDVRVLAKVLLRTARYATLAALEPIDGAPAISRVALATDIDGRPVFLMSRLSGHFAALEADPRCALLFGEPGDRGDPLSHPRISVGGQADVIVDQEERKRLRGRFLAKNPKSKLYVDFPDMAFWRLCPDRVSFNGGFGKAYAPVPGDLLCQMIPELARAEAGVIEHMNDDHSDAVDRYAASVGAETSGWKLACIDPEGMDLFRSGEVKRVWFDAPVSTAAELKAMLVKLAKA